MSIFDVLGSAVGGALSGFAAGGPVGAVGGGILGLMGSRKGAASSAVRKVQDAAGKLQATGLAYLGSERARADLQEARDYTTSSYGTALSGMRNLPLYQLYSPGAASAYSARQALLGLGADPTQGQMDAFRRYRQSAGYKDAMRMGQFAVTGSRAASGLLGSGQTARALTQYGHQLGRQAFGDYMGQLQSQIPMGLSADQLYSQGLMGRAGAQSNVASALSQLRSQYGLQPYLTATSALGEAQETRGGGSNNLGSGISDLMGSVARPRPEVPLPPPRPTSFSPVPPARRPVPIPTLRPRF